MQMPILETTRLSIRPLTLEDELACHDLYVDIQAVGILESEDPR